ncbi:hypothetical protein Pint_26604 [Pistacia integerrima]|uniref:Uncharacterized protein n=1 Tax=Pistacia integerrima TaxID=434235 RepID=A0ACC0YRS9_9ROSI|nr:hypothetical protein Pint_26604 [Pistacia integerrima]
MTRGKADRKQNGSGDDRCVACRFCNVVIVLQISEASRGDPIFNARFGGFDRKFG